MLIYLSWYESRIGVCDKQPGSNNSAIRDRDTVLLRPLLIQLNSPVVMLVQREID